MATTYKTQVGAVERTMTETEIAEYELILNDIAALAQAEADAQAAKNAAHAKLALLGLTTDDLLALGL
jgi:hypothetical protein